MMGGGRWAVDRGGAWAVDRGGAWAVDRGGAWDGAPGFCGARRALREAGRGQSGGCRRLRHTCVAGVLDGALWGSGPGTIPSSLDTKAADDADVPGLVGVCLVQLTQLLGGCTDVSASGIAQRSGTGGR